MEKSNPGEAFSIPTFCKLYGISRALFYKLKKNGNGPQTFHVGRRVLISRQAAKEWLAEMEGRAA